MSDRISPSSIYPQGQGSELNADRLDGLHLEGVVASVGTALAKQPDISRAVVAVSQVLGMSADDARTIVAAIVAAARRL